MRIAYHLLTFLLLPVYACYWFFRGFANRAYWDKFSQRFGVGFPALADGTIWLHAVSVGEVQASAPLVRALAGRFPGRQLLITTVTPTGAARVESLFGDSVKHSYIPFETPNAVRNFFNSTRPALALIMETEIWPNLYAECGRRRIPLILVSARISPKSVDSYRRFLPLFRETLSHGIVIAAQSEKDAERFRSLGAAPERTWVTGNIKFDIEVPKDLVQRGAEARRELFGERNIWVAASTHEKEEEMVLSAHRQVRERFRDALLILIPRHPERFGSVRSLLQRRKSSFVARTEDRACGPETEVFLGDTMGEVPLFYAASDIAFVGGTLVPIGGHNLLEPAALGRPIITGPYLFNTQDIADKFASLGASVTVETADELGNAVCELIDNDEEAAAMGNRGRDILLRNRGALDRLMAQLEPLIDGVG